MAINHVGQFKFGCCGQLAPNVAAKVCVADINVVDAMDGVSSSITTRSHLPTNVSEIIADISSNSKPTFFDSQPITTSVIEVSHAHQPCTRPLSMFWLTGRRQKLLSADTADKSNVGKCEQGVIRAGTDGKEQVINFWTILIFRHGSHLRRLEFVITLLTHGEPWIWVTFGYSGMFLQQELTY